jgi:hypothetical protein
METFMKIERKGVMRGYKKLRVWQDAKMLFVLTWKLENGLKKLVESLQEKQSSKEWSDTFLVKESNEAYTTSADQPSSH